MFCLALWKVRLGRAGRFRAFGKSMEPLIPSGSRLTVEPIDRERIELGDIVVARVGDSTMVHLVKTIDRGGPASRDLGHARPGQRLDAVRTRLRHLHSDRREPTAWC
jgi:phage repressor protein C with HTH and peptisase S24 domain